MPADEMDPNAARDVVVTYKRKRAGAAAAPLPEDASRAGGKDSNRQSRKSKVKDIGWEHGVIVHGNRFHWQCKWCGLMRYGGGVSRLKRHIAGTSDTIKCPKVPEDISRAMREYLMEKEKQKKKRLGLRDFIEERNLEHSPLDDAVEQDGGQIGCEMKATQHRRRITKRSRIALRNFKSKFSRSDTATLQLKNEMVKGFRAYEEDGSARNNYHWRKVLKHMLRLPDSSGGGIMTCVHDALTSCPFGRHKKFKMNTDIKGSAHAHPKYRNDNRFEGGGQSERFDASIIAKSDELKFGTNGQADSRVNTMKCQNVFLDVLLSEKFALLCDLLCGNFLHVKYKNIFDFSPINSRMKSGGYEESPGLFDQDIQEVWEKFQKIGHEMVLLSSGLAQISRASFLEQVGEGLAHQHGEQKPEGIECLDVEENNSIGSNTTSNFPASRSEGTINPDETKPSCLYKVSTCKQCGIQTDGKCSLTCAGCNSAFHFSCIEYPVSKIPAQSWYCSDCSLEPVLTRPHDCLHQNCTVCGRLELSRAQRQLNERARETSRANDFRENSVSCTESDEPPESSGTALSRLCKQCGLCEDEDKRFLICGNAHCLYKYYHIRCLRSSQIASYHQQNQLCWYCPSCLCRACLSDKDDEKIVMCDGCDEAYHTYCMKPPLASVPEGRWYCSQCNVAKAKEGMRTFELLILEQHAQYNLLQASGVGMSVDLLLKAAEKLSSEEKLAVVEKE